MEREVNQINVIPLVDVMLVLLVIVLTTATFISTGQIPVNLAKAKEAGDHKDVPVVVTLTANGDLFLNDRPVPADGAGATVGEVTVGLGSPGALGSALFAVAGVPISLMITTVFYASLYFTFSDCFAADATEAVVVS